MMHTLFMNLTTTAPILAPEPSPAPESQPDPNGMLPVQQLESFADQAGYDSDCERENSGSEAERDPEDADMGSTKCMPAAPLCKWRKLEVSYLEQRRQLWVKLLAERMRALVDLEKLLKSVFVGGPQGLQAHHTLAMASHFKMVIQNS
jgi:hypothetical protein